MATVLKPVDAVIVGMGWTGSIAAKELAEAGLRVVALERGQFRNTVPDFQSPAMHDELKFAVRHGLMQDVSRETVTFRNRADQHALPMRQLASFLPGTDVGGAGVHWNGQTFRFLPTDFTLRSHVAERYGAGFIPEELSVQDWPITYDELEPHYDRFEYLCGIGGKAGNLKGQIQTGGNPYEGPRSRDYPNPPMKTAHAGALFAKAAAELGYSPFPVPSANMSQPYRNPEGVDLNACAYCGFCERFGCEHFAKSSPQTTILPKALANKNVELRTQCHVLRVNLDKRKQRATGVTYVDAHGRETVQPADLVLLGTWAFNNVRLLLLSGIGKPYDPRTGEGVVGRNYAYQTMSGVSIFFEDKLMNPYMGAGALGMVIDDYNGDNFDHKDLGFIGGAYIAAYTTGARPIEYHPVPTGTPRWGLGWRRAVQKYYLRSTSLQCHGSSMASRANFVDLDPTYRDAFGQPLLRITFDFPDNDVKMANYLAERAEEIAHRMDGSIVISQTRSKPYAITTYQTTHNTGGAIMGADPKTSATNRYGQTWDVPNVFVMGTALYPQNAGYNPTDTVGALAYWTLDAIKSQYLKNPGPLVKA